MIREYKSEDREAIERCIFEFHEGERVINPHYWVSSENIAKPYFDYLTKKTTEGDGKIFVVEIDDKVVGYVAVRIETEDSPRVVQKKRGYVSNIVVLKDFQGKVLGGALLKRAEEFSKENSATYIYLDVTINKPAVGFYHNQGYIEQSVYMEKKLNE